MTEDYYLPFFDPHFHIWDTAQLHSIDTLGDPARQFPTYSLADYEAHMARAEIAWEGSVGDALGGPRLRHVGGVVVEALPNGDRGADEIEWIQQQVLQDAQQQEQAPRVPSLNRHSGNSGPRTYLYSARLHLLHPTRDEELARLAAHNVTAVRHILNFEPSWPFVSSNMLLNDQWIASLCDLPSKGIRLFELHCNTHQLLHAAEIVKRCPGLTFVLNHMGNRRDGVDPYEHWRRGVAALAESKNCLVKLSDPNYVDPAAWDSNESVTSMVHDLLGLFGSKRCMVATNYPVACACSAPPERLFPWFRNVFAHLSSDDLENIFSRTAMAAYTPTLASSQQQ